MADQSWWVGKRVVSMAELYKNADELLSAVNTHNEPLILALRGKFIAIVQPLPGELQGRELHLKSGASWPENRK